MTHVPVRFQGLSERIEEGSTEVAPDAAAAKYDSELGEVVTRVPTIVFDDETGVQ